MSKDVATYKALRLRTIYGPLHRNANSPESAEDQFNKVLDEHSWGTVMMESVKVQVIEGSPITCLITFLMEVECKMAVRVD